ncbi:hypothetical protein [Halocalculus aciditolerans]|uniref:Profilin fold domain-containing protein n=1 Tax=Halocalculus aciditolerans TaxID=1383812 RepID=A0A830F7T1_9EURY|nr:hypothetical protein [Halocalculus aciditolerans]GGL47671.1 hypothetical protein GCM10009039_02400 [Halocalculus aciditolerans]
MTESPDLDVPAVASAEDAAARRDEVVAWVREHAGKMAYELARLQGGDYGRRSFKTEGGEWTVKYEAGELEFLRFEGRAGRDVYVVSTQQPPEPEGVAAAMKHYPDLVAAFNEHVASLEHVLDDVPDDVPEIASAEAVVAERDRLLSPVEEAADEMAAQLHRVESDDYGTYAATVNGTRWELKRDVDRASYVRVGGEGGVYLVSQYGPPSVSDTRRHAAGFRDFVDAFNDEIASLHADLDDVEL